MDETEADKNLNIYLNDHHAACVGGSDLAKRALGNSTDPERSEMWETISREVEEDCRTLEEIMKQTGTTQNQIKAALTHLAEKAGRLKPNGRLTGPSELGQFLELEAMLLAVTGKAEIWSTLRMVDDPRLHSFDFAALIKRAESQRERLEDHRLSLAGTIFT